MRKTRGTLWVALFGVLVVGLVAGPDLWAAPGQSPARQTVPTRTPEQPPTPEPTNPPPKPKPEKPQPTAAPEVTPTASPVPAEGASGPLLPEVGGWSVRLPLSIATVLFGLLILVGVRRRAQG